MWFDYAVLDVNGLISIRVRSRSMSFNLGIGCGFGKKTNSLKSRGLLKSTVFLCLEVLDQMQEIAFSNHFRPISFGFVL